MLSGHAVLTRLIISIHATPSTEWRVIVQCWGIYRGIIPSTAVERTCPMERDADNLTIFWQVKREIRSFQVQNMIRTVQLTPRWIYTVTIRVLITQIRFRMKTCQNLDFYTDLD